MTSTGHAERVQQVTRLARQGERSELCDGVSEGKEEGGKREKSGGNEKRGSGCVAARVPHTWPGHSRWSKRSERQGRQGKTSGASSV